MTLLCEKHQTPLDSSEDGWPCWRCAYENAAKDADHFHQELDLLRARVRRALEDSPDGEEVT